MSIKEYTSMRTKDWVQAAGTLANIYAKLKGQQGANNGRDSTEQCDGIIQVSGYTRADGTEVAPYERICPYHYNGQKPENKDKKGDKNKGKDFSLSGTVSSNETTNDDDVIKLKKNLYKMNYYKPNERSEPDEKFHKYANIELITAIKDFQRDNNLPITGRISSGDETERVLNKILRQTYPYNRNFERAYNKLQEPEGDYTDGKDQVRDEPTNMGIKQSTLDRYANKHPDKNFPADVKYLTATQAKEIYRHEYWDNTKIPEIKNDRIRDAVFDMNVMGQYNAGKVVQRTLNEYSDTNLVVDGIIGSKTISELNSIPSNKINEFMKILIEQRMNNLRGMTNWSTSKNGWAKRTKAY